MKADLPSTFASDTDAQAQRTKYIKKYGTKGSAYWDAVYYNKTSTDTNGEYNYPKGAPKADTSNAGKTGTLPDSRKFLVADDGETLLDPKTKKPL